MRPSGVAVQTRAGSPPMTRPSSLSIAVRCGVCVRKHVSQCDHFDIAPFSALASMILWYWFQPTGAFETGNTVSPIRLKAKPLAARDEPTPTIPRYRLYLRAIASSLDVGSYDVSRTSECIEPFIRSVTGIRYEPAEQRDGSDFCPQRRFGGKPTKPFQHWDGLDREEGRVATKSAAWSSGRSDPGRRPLVRHSLGPDVAQYGVNGRRLRQRSRDLRGGARPRPGGARSRRRQLPGAEGRPSGRTGQGAVSDRRRDQTRDCRYGDSGAGGSERQRARHRSGGHEFGAGRSSTLSRPSTTRSPCSMPGSPMSIRPRPRLRWLSSTSIGPPNWW